MDCPRLNGVRNGPTSQLVVVFIEKHNMDLTEEDYAAIGRAISFNGYTSGIIDKDGYRIAWTLSADKFPY